MAQNKILPWAQTSTANALSDADYAADVANGGSYADGVKSGQASSKQANKTWRQATAPASGLGQFLVDNLSVDVTDADTPATFSTRIANAVLKLAQISPFNQSWAAATGGYRKYAIVSDSSGNFWVSTADQNTTTPGADGTKWQSLFDGYATQSWANTAFVKNNAGTQGGIVALDLDSDGSGRAAFQRNDGSWGSLQPAGDYATNTALNTETTNRTNADTDLQSQINNRVLKTGDTSTGSQIVRNKYSNGTLHWAPGWTSVIAGMSGGSSNGDYSFGMFAQELDDNYTAGILSLNGFQGRKDFRFNEDGNIFTPLGRVALESDIANLQNQINGKQPAGDYVTGLAPGKIMQDFIVGVSGSGVHDIAFPRAFSSPPTTIVISYGLTNGSNSPVSVLGGWTSTGFQIQTNGSTSVNFLAVGPS